jgi:hypothetical protein
MRPVVNDEGPCAHVPEIGALQIGPFNVDFAPQLCG